MAEESAYKRAKAQHERVIAINRGGAMPRDYGQNFNDIAELLADYERMQAELEEVAMNRADAREARDLAMKQNDRLKAELETVRGERDAMREALGQVRTLTNEAGAYSELENHPVMDHVGAMNGIVVTALDGKATATSQSQPAPKAEWTPSIGDKVRVIECADNPALIDATGKIVIAHGELYKWWVYISGHDMVDDDRYAFHVRELEPAD